MEPDENQDTLSYEESMEKFTDLLLLLEDRSGQKYPNQIRFSGFRLECT